MPNGYTGNVLHVDLTAGELSVENPTDDFYRMYMGGSAMGLHYLMKESTAGVDALGPENVLCLFNGIMTGTPISGQSRLTSTCKSPLTDAAADSQSGGFFPAELKFAGYDGLVIKGKSEKPVYLWIKDGNAELRDASHLWGKITGEAEAMLKEELEDNKIEVLQVGPAGEQMVRYGALISMSNRANGRTGTGAVMGSKNLKAIAVRGKKRPGIADRKALIAKTKQGTAAFPDSDVYGLGKYGTAETVLGQDKSGGLPTFNFNSGTFENCEDISGEMMYDTILAGADRDMQSTKGRDTCYSCAVRCKRVVDIKEGPYKVDPHYGGPEYETLATFGSYCGVDDLAAISKANEYCNKYGMDTISCGATIAWAMEAFEAGKLSLEDTGGIDLSFGNAETMVTLTKMIGERKGFGDLLAEGSARAAEKIGRGTEAYLITSKKQEAPAHMPQVKPTLSIIYATNPFGSDHQSHEHDASYRFYGERMAEVGLTNPQEKMAFNEEMMNYAMVTQFLYSAMDSINVCQFVYGPSWQLYSTQDLLEAAIAVTGWDLTMDELITVGERRLNMMRAYNAREGLDKDYDELPEKMFKKGLKGGRSDGYKIDHEEWLRMRDHYYALNGWNVESGNPSAEKLQSLGVGWIAEENVLVGA
jgi:aldehyde:ferredoxin oxidoreductase